MDDRHQYLLHLHQETGRAFLVSKSENGDRRGSYSAFWLPKSQVTEVSRRTLRFGAQQILLEIPEWLAQRNGLDASLDGEDDSLIEPV